MFFRRLSRSGAAQKQGRTCERWNFQDSLL
jgi:hypothetical protein